MERNPAVQSYSSAPKRGNMPETDIIQPHGLPIASESTQMRVRSPTAGECFRTIPGLAGLNGAYGKAGILIGCEHVAKRVVRWDS